MNGVSSPGKPYWLNLTILLQWLSVCVYPNCGLDTDWTLIICDNWSSSHKKNHVYWAPVISRVSSSTSSKSSSSSIMSTWKQRAFDKRIKRIQKAWSWTVGIVASVQLHQLQWRLTATSCFLLFWRHVHSPDIWSRGNLGFGADRYDENAARLVHEADKLWHTYLASLQCLSIASNLVQNSQIFSTVLMLTAPCVLGYLKDLSLCGSGLLRQKNVLTSLSHGSIWRRDHQNSSIHLACSSHICGKTAVQNKKLAIVTLITNARPVIMFLT